jgi:hypothetical protein
MESIIRGETSYALEPFGIIAKEDGLSRGVDMKGGRCFWKTIF